VKARGGNGKRQVALLFGGRSAEHEISIRSARAVAEHIDGARYDTTLIGIDRAGRWLLHDDKSFERLGADAAAGSDRRVILISGEGRHRLIELSHPDRELPALDVVFPVLHGTFGEDGTLQGFLDTVGVPYVGAGVLGSAIGMDKDVQKRLLREADLPVVDFQVVTRHEWLAERVAARRRLAAIGLPLFVKPCNLGSSVGIRRVGADADLEAAVDFALSYDDKVIAEHGVDAREIECSVLGNDEPRASLPGEIVPGDEFYSYDAKYSAASEAKLLIPAPLDGETTESIRHLSVRAFRVLDCSGMARVDFLVARPGGEIYVNELNTIPGFTSISMYPKLWEASGLPFSELVGRLIELALERFGRRQQHRLR
jgi:D-alanine-D-alanine ligase